MTRGFGLKLPLFPSFFHARRPPTTLPPFPARFPRPLTLFAPHTPSHAFPPHIPLPHTARGGLKWHANTYHVAVTAVTGWISMFLYGLKRACSLVFETSNDIEIHPGTTKRQHETCRDVTQDTIAVRLEYQKQYVAYIMNTVY